MQNRYAGDIGDFVKFGLLRALSKDRRLGVAWYLHPDEGHNADGKHVHYLEDQARWRHLDPDLFDKLKGVVQTGRAIRSLEDANVLNGRFSSEPLESAKLDWRQRTHWRYSWFERVCTELADVDLVFADPDNGLVDDNLGRTTRKVFAKQMPIREALRLAQGRVAVVYHHNTRRSGGHDLEVDHWLGQFGDQAIAVRANAYSCRTFFILNADEEVKRRAAAFCSDWAGLSVRLHRAVKPDD